MPMYLSLSLLSSGVAIPLPEQNGLPKSAHVIDRESILAVNAALATGRPLLVRGEPGTGKSQLARAVAQVLGRAFVQHAVDSRTETRDLLWSLDAVARLAEAQLIGSLRDALVANRRIAKMEVTFELSGNAEQGELRLTTPLGTTAAMTASPTVSSGTPYTTTCPISGIRCRIRSIGAAARFSPSTRNQSAVRPAR